MGNGVKNGCFAKARGGEKKEVFGVKILNRCQTGVLRPQDLEKGEPFILDFSSGKEVKRGNNWASKREEEKKSLRGEAKKLKRC